MTSEQSANLTFADHVRARAEDDNVAILFEDSSITYRQWCREVARRASLWRSVIDAAPTGTSPHIGVMLDNTPEFTMWLGAAAVTGASVVGINSTRRGAELARDIVHTSCRVVVTDSTQSGLLDGLDLGDANGRVFVVDSTEHGSLLAEHDGARLPTSAQCPVEPSSTFLLLFTSGTSDAPKAVITSHQRVNFVSGSMVMITELTSTDVTYISMPLFHSNALLTAWAPSVLSGATIALRRKFSASEFMPDVRRYGATYFNYVGKPLTYILATPESPNDRDHKLRLGFGNEGSEVDLARFAERFGVRLIDGYGQTETGASIVRVPGMPAGALGVAAQPTITVRDPGSNRECPRAVFDDRGRVLNLEEATGEIVNAGGGMFEGYFNNEEANRERLRDGAYWTGDLAYRDESGFFYFAGRSADWMRVDGENFAGAPIERIIMRHPSVLLATVYGVPDPEIGDRVMVAMQLKPDTNFDIDEFASFLSTQGDLSPKWLPSFVQVVDGFPMTSTNKVLKRDLVKRRWHDVEGEGSARIWWRRGRETNFVSFDAAAAVELRRRFESVGRGQMLA